MPLPLGPVMTVSFPRGRSTSMPLRLFWRAPRISTQPAAAGAVTHAFSATFEPTGDYPRCAAAFANFRRQNAYPAGLEAKPSTSRRDCYTGSALTRVHTANRGDAFFALLQAARRAQRRLSDSKNFLWPSSSLLPLLVIDPKKLDASHLCERHRVRPDRDPPDAARQPIGDLGRATVAFAAIDDPFQARACCRRNRAREICRPRLCGTSSRERSAADSSGAGRSRASAGNNRRCCSRKTAASPSDRAAPDRPRRSPRRSFPKPWSRRHKRRGPNRTPEKPAASCRCGVRRK